MVREYYGGGSVYTKNINDKPIVYSFGIGEDVSFDLDFYKKFNYNIFCFDPTPKSIDWIKKQELLNSISFFEYGISNKNDSVDFFLPKNPDHASGSILHQQNVNTDNKVTVQMNRLKNIATELGHKHIDIIKLDIEGAEYEVLNDIVNSKLSINQILVEFHDRFFENGRNMSKQAVNKLKENGYKIFEVSGSFQEVAFIKENAL